MNIQAGIEADAPLESGWKNDMRAPSTDQYDRKLRHNARPHSIRSRILDRRRDLDGRLSGLDRVDGLESACIPLPSEIIMPFAGYLASTGHFTLSGAAAMGALGCNLGSTLAYCAFRGGRPGIPSEGDHLGTVRLLRAHALAAQLDRALPHRVANRMR